MGEEIVIIARHEIDQIAFPQKCSVDKIYSGGFVDVTVEDGSKLSYLPCVGDTVVGETGLVVFLNNNQANPVVVSSNGYTKPEIDEIIDEIIHGDIDLSKYVKKSDVDLKFNLETNGYITLGLDIGDGF